MSKPYVIMSTDAGSVSLTGQNGSLINVLDSILVNGINSKSVTSLVVASNIGTVTCTGHGFLDRQTAYLYNQVVKISGCDQVDCNENWEVASITDANTFTITMTGVSDGTKTGTMTVKQAPLGWTKEFSGTNKAAYRQSEPVSGNRQFWRFQDDSSVTEGAKYSRVNIYETMSAVDSGTNPAPTTGYRLVLKSSTADATARPYIIIGDSYGFWLIVFYNSATIGTTDNACVFHFGKIISEVPNDNWADLLAAGESANGISPVFNVNTMASNYTAIDVSLDFIRKSDGQVGSVTACKLPGFGGMDNVSYKTAVGSVGFSFPFNNQTLYTKLILTEINRRNFRGYFPGLYYPIHNRPHNNFACFADGEKKLMPVCIFVTGDSVSWDYVSNNNGQVYFDLGTGFRP
jgi:hypothetical protein